MRTRTPRSESNRSSHVQTASTHFPELTRFTGSADGGRPAFYRMPELYFPALEQMEASLQSAGGMATLHDLPNFAPGGVTVMVGRVTS
ncbi:MAG TPA: EthD family reductase [Terriglobales bacterium]